MINHYFDSIVGEGTFNKDAREELEDKYWLDQKQYKRMAPPDLSQTKLHMVDNLDFSGLSNTLMSVQRSPNRPLRRSWCRVWTLQRSRPWWTRSLVIRRRRTLLSTLANKKMVESLQPIADLAYRELSVAQTAAIAGKQLHAALTDVVWDGLQLLGQHDVTI